MYVHTFFILLESLGSTLAHIPFQIYFTFISKLPSPGDYASRTKLSGLTRPPTKPASMYYSQPTGEICTYTLTPNPMRPQFFLVFSISISFFDGIGDNGISRITRWLKLAEFSFQHRMCKGTTANESYHRVCMYMYRSGHLIPRLEHRFTHIPANASRASSHLRPTWSSWARFKLLEPQFNSSTRRI
jgi:hypothetical protein